MWTSLANRLVPRQHYAFRNASRSALIVSACVVGMPCGEKRVGELFGQNSVILRKRSSRSPEDRGNRGASNQRMLDVSLGRTAREHGRPLSRLSPARARESGMRTINPTIATTITMTTTFGSLKLWLPTTSAAAMLRWPDTKCHYPSCIGARPPEQPTSPKAQCDKQKSRKDP